MASSILSNLKEKIKLVVTKKAKKILYFSAEQLSYSGVISSGAYTTVYSKNVSINQTFAARTEIFINIAFSANIISTSTSPSIAQLNVDMNINFTDGTNTSESRANYFIWSYNGFSAGSQNMPVNTIRNKVINNNKKISSISITVSLKSNSANEVAINEDSKDSLISILVVRNKVDSITGNSYPPLPSPCL